MVHGFTEPFTGRAITSLLGLPIETTERIAQDAGCLGFVMGPDAKQHEAEVNAALDRLAD